MVTGKGGVGKSTVAASLALSLSEKGERVLLVELGSVSYFQHVFRAEIHQEPTEVRKNLDVSVWCGESCLKEYVGHFVKIKKLVDLFFDNRVMRTFIKAAPALKELAILGKLTSGVRRWGPDMPYDVIVFDSYSTGHHLALLKAPIGMHELIDAGPMGEQSRNIVKVLKDKDHVQTILVTLAEEMPVEESLELNQALINVLGHKPEIVCNKLYWPGLTKEELGQLESSNQNSASLDFIRFLKDRTHRQTESLEKLSKSGESYFQSNLVLKPTPLEIVCELSAHEYYREKSI